MLSTSSVFVDINLLLSGEFISNISCKWYCSNSSARNHKSMVVRVPVCVSRESLQYDNGETVLHPGYWKHLLTICRLLLRKWWLNRTDRPVRRRILLRERLRRSTTVRLSCRKVLSPRDVRSSQMPSRYIFEWYTTGRPIRMQELYSRVLLPTDRFDGRRRLVHSRILLLGR